MKHIFKKAFNLSDISYSGLLAASLVFFIGSLYYGKINTDMTPAMEWIVYSTPICIATVWGILNYIDHIKINARYKKFDNIDVYVDNLIMSRDEKLELKGYLEDYSTDLMNQGKPREEAVKTAIGQFAVQEFASVSKNSSIINLSIHYYLMGYAMIAFLAGLLLQMAAAVMLIQSFWVQAAKFMFLAYGIGFIALFFLYKLMDSILSKNINESSRV